MWLHRHLSLTGSDNQSVAAATSCCRSAATDIKLTSDALDVDRRQPKTWRGGAGGVMVIEGKVRGADKSWARLEALTADQSGRLQGGCRVPASDFSAFSFPFYPNFNKLFFIFAFRGNSLPPHVCMLTEILQTQSHLSSHRQPLNTLLRRRHGGKRFASSLPNVSLVSLPSIRNESLTVQRTASDYRSYFLETCNFVCLKVDYIYILELNVSALKWTRRCFGMLRWDEA